jgi:2-haloalkanoic acid dehalogenase type II
MQPRPRVVVFDVNETLSDMAPTAGRFADVGAPGLLATAWFAAVLRDGFALAAAGGKEAFSRLARGALEAALARATLNHPAAEAVDHILAGFGGLSVHPDVPGGVRLLRDGGMRLVTLSNGCAEVAGRLLAGAGIGGEFEQLLGRGRGRLKTRGRLRPRGARVLGPHRADAAGGRAPLGHPRRTPGGHAHRVDQQAAGALPWLLRRTRPASTRPERPGQADPLLTRCAPLRGEVCPGAGWPRQGPAPGQAVLGALCGYEAVTFRRAAAELGLA